MATAITQSGVSRAQPQRRRLVQAGIQTLGIGTFYVLILLFFSFASPEFFTYSNAVNILTNVSVTGA